MAGELHRKELSVCEKDEKAPPRFWADPLWRRWISFALASVFLAGAAGLPRLEFNDQYRNMFESDSPEYAAYLKYSREFGSGDNRWIVLVESNDLPLISPSLIPILRDLDFDLRMEEVAESVISIFDARSREVVDGYFPPLIPSDDSNPSRFRVADSEARIHPLVGDILISEDGRAALWIVSQGDEDLPVVELQTVLSSLNRIVEEYSGREGLRLRITGLPAMRCEVIRLLHRQNSIFYPLVALVGLVVSWLLLRNVPAVFLTVAAPLAGSVLALGIMGWLGIPLNAINNILAPLIMVIGFADSVHLVFQFGRLKSSGMSRVEAAWGSLKRVGPACLITSVTTAVALLSLQFTETTILRQFGWTAALAVLVMFLSVVLLTPLFSASLMGDRVEIMGGPRTSGDPIFWEKLGGLLARRCGAVFLLFLVGLGVSLCLAVGLRPDYRYSEYLPQSNPVASALEDVDTRFSGSSFLSLVIERETLDGDLAEALPMISKIEEILRSESELGSPRSLKTILEAFPVAGSDLEEKVSNFLIELPEEALSGMVGSSGRGIRVAVPVPELGAGEMKEILLRLEKGLEVLREAHPYTKFYLSGLPVLSAEASSNMIFELAASLLAASLVIFVFIGLFVRSPALGIATLLPNLLPLAATAAILFLFGHPLQYTSVLVFTICLGIAVDDSIHFLVSYRRLRNRSGARSDDAIVGAMSEVGPAISATSVILVAGLAVLIFSEVPTTRLFGQLACLAIFWAWIADLSFLPASLSFGRKIHDRLRSST